MFGYACDQTEELMPLPIALAHGIMHRLAKLRHDKVIPWLRPDSKSQVSVEYRDGKPRRITTIVVSTQHSPEVSQQTIHDEVIAQAVKPVLPPDIDASDAVYHINPTGRFVVGGPQGDCGLTGRKIIVDTYGGSGRHGGGAFSGKDPTKVDRSASYMARHVAKNLVAAGLADRAEVQLAYAIGVADPVSVHVETFGTEKVDPAKLPGLVRDHFKLTPQGIIQSLDLRRPIYRKTAAYGHFGRRLPEFTWERTDKAEALAAAAGLAVPTRA